MLRPKFCCAIAMTALGISSAASVTAQVRTGQTFTVSYGIVDRITSAGHVGLTSPETVAKRDEDAADCHAAKEAALRARNESEIDVALKKVRVFCES